jgi:hypothetical protein
VPLSRIRSHLVGPFGLSRLPIWIVRGWSGSQRLGSQAVKEQQPSAALRQVRFAQGRELVEPEEMRGAD